MFSSSSKPLFPYFIDLSTYFAHHFYYATCNEHVTDSKAFYSLLYMQSSQCIEKLNGLSIIFCRSHSPHMQYPKRIQTTALYGLAQACPINICDCLSKNPTCSHKLKFILLPQFIATPNNYTCSLPPLANVNWSAFLECFLLTI